MYPREGVRGSAPLSPQVTRPPLPRLYQPHDPPRHACSRSQRSLVQARGDSTIPIVSIEVDTQYYE